MSTDGRNSDVIPSMLTADVEYPIAAKLTELRVGEATVGENIWMRGQIDGPHANNKAQLEVQCREEVVTVKVKIQKWDLPTSRVDEVEYGETTLGDYGEEFGHYGTVVGETVINELGCKPDEFTDAVRNGDEIEFTQYKLLDGKGYREPNEFQPFVCELDTEAFWELDDRWDDAE